MREYEYCPYESYSVVKSAVVVVGYTDRYSIKEIEVVALLPAAINASKYSQFRILGDEYFHDITFGCMAVTTNALANDNWHIFLYRNTSSACNGQYSIICKY